MAYRYDVYGVGNAIVDTEVELEDSFLTGHRLDKGIMTLVPAEAQAELLESLADHAQHGSAGGSAANTMTAVAHFGGSAFFTGKIGDDMHGALYRESLAEAGAYTPLIDRVYPLEEARAAHAYVDTGRKKGNVVLRVG